jgi:hypothetical protein
MNFHKPTESFAEKMESKSWLAAILFIVRTSGGLQIKHCLQGNELKTKKNM